MGDSLMKKIVLTILVFPFILIANEKSWPGTTFTEVKAFHWPLKISKRSLISNEFELVPGAINKAGVKLNKDQVKILQRSVVNKFPPHPAAACYSPHNVFVFYNGKKPVAFIEICFDCLGYRSFPKAPADNFDLLSIAKICQQLKIPFGSDKDLKSLESFLKE